MSKKEITLPQNSWLDLPLWKTPKYEKLLDGIGDLDLVYPLYPYILRHLRTTSFEDVKVVILGNEPYAYDSRSTGLAFDERPGKRRTTHTYRTIIDEYSSDLGIKKPYHTSFLPWAEKGVLLHNVKQTVGRRQKDSHADLGWELLTYEIVSALSYEKPGLVWLLWGKEAEYFRPAIWYPDRHCILSTTSPSIDRRWINVQSTPSFIGSRPFTTAAEYLGVDPIRFWRLM